MQNLLLMLPVYVGLISTITLAMEPLVPSVTWSFDEGQGTIAHAATEHEAEIQGPTWVQQGDGFALSFDGDDDYIDCGSSHALGIGGPITIEAWVKPTRKAHGEAMLLGEDMHSYLLTYYNTEICLFYIGSGANNVKGKLILDQWNHVVASFDGQRLSMWVNGQLTATRKSKFKSYRVRGRFMMGTKGRADLPKFKGLMDHVRVYGAAFSNEQAAAHFKAEASEYGFDPTWFDRIKVATYDYFDRGEIVVEVDYRMMLPLTGRGRVDVALFREDDPKTIVKQQVIDPLPAKVGAVEVKLPCDGLRDGRYVIRTTLRDGQGARPTEERIFSYPPKVRTLVSPNEKIVSDLPAARNPTVFEFVMGKKGGFTLKLKQKTYSFATRISWPNGEFNHLAPETQSLPRNETSWKLRVRKVGKNKYQVDAGGDFYTLRRRIEIFPTHIEIKDTYTNTTNDDLGLLIYNEMQTQADEVVQSLLSGYERRGRQVELPSADYGPSVFFADNNAGIGIVPTDDVFVIQAIPYIDWQDAAGIGTERFALAAKKSYTLQWAIYPTGSRDYYDFINTFRKVEGRIATVTGAPGFITRTPHAPVRREIPDKNFIEKRNLKIGMMHSLSEVGGDPNMHVEGIEMTRDFPKEMQLLTEQVAAIHAQLPGLKVIPHIAHSLYVTNRPDQFPDAKVIGPNGKQTSWGEGAAFGTINQAKNWRWWIFYPTPGNSFHHAMLESVDVMMDEMGFDGGFMDGFFTGYGGLWSYDTDIRWDEHSALINLKTKTITRKINSVLLLSQSSMIEYARKIRDKGGVVVAMHTVFTPSIADEKYILFANEAASGPQTHLAPNAMALGMNKGFDTEKDIYRDILDKLRWGQLYIHYTDGMTLTHPSLAAYQYPMTFEQIRRGLVKGPKRIVTMNAGIQGWPNDNHLHLIHKFDGRGAPVPNDFLTTVDYNETRTELSFVEYQSAVIERIPVKLETTSPVNVRVTRYDADGFAVQLHGQGDVTLHLSDGLFSIQTGKSYRVGGLDVDEIITSEKTTLSIPLHLNGLTQITLE